VHGEGAARAEAERGQKDFEEIEAEAVQEEGC
jgi:hypothetical protein